MKKQENNVGYINQEMTTVMPSVKKMVDKVKAQKKVNIRDEELEDAIARMFNYIKYFNSLGENVSIVFNNTDINKVNVLGEFADFVTPSSVRLDPTNLRSKNLLVGEIKIEAPGDFNDYVNLCDTIRGFFKKDSSSNLVPLVNCKKSVNLQSVIHKASCKIDGVYMVNYGNDAFYPIRLQGIDVLYESRHFNATENDLVADYLSNFQF